MSLQLRNAAPACQQRGALAAALLVLVTVARGGAAAQSEQGPVGWWAAHFANSGATQLGNTGAAVLRCNVPAIAVDACLKRSATARHYECLELATYLMAAPRLTRVGFEADSHDTLHCTYLALATVTPSRVAPDTTFLLSLGLLLSARGNVSWPLALVRFDAAPLAHPRLPALEVELQGTLREVYADLPSTQPPSPSALQRLLQGAEALELFGALRSQAMLSRSTDALAAEAERMEEEQEAARSARLQQLLPATRQLAQLLLRAPPDDDGRERAAFEARAGTLLAALDVMSQNDCAMLARRLEAHAVRLVAAPLADNAEARADMQEVVDAVGRAHRLSPVDACARAVVANTADVVALFSYMKQLQVGGLGPVVGHMMLPPPRGEAPHAKSAEAVAEAFGIFEMLTKQEPLNGGLPLPQQQKEQQQQPIKGPPAKAAASAVAAPPAAGAQPVTRGVVALGSRLIAVLLLSVAAWRYAAAAERRRHNTNALRRHNSKAHDA
jgi:hypothetical protein